MDRKASKKRPTGAVATKLFALLLVICLVECATGSCLNYGHSCWGAHGKRSAEPPATSPDWYISRLLRRMADADDAEMNNVKQLTPKNDDINAIYPLDLGYDALVTNKLMSYNNDGPAELPRSRNPEAKPMLDDDLLSKMKIWQMMRESSENK